MQQSVFISIHRCRPDECRLWKYVANHLLGTCFGSKELGWGVLTGIEGGYMYEPIDVVLRDGFSYALSALDVNVFQGEVSEDISQECR